MGLLAQLVMHLNKYCQRWAWCILIFFALLKQTLQHQMALLASETFPLTDADHQEGAPDEDHV